MRDAQKPSSLDLTKLLNRLKDGRFVIPDFQRDFEWEPWDIAQLVRSIFLDYYIGSLLLWKGKSEKFDALACEAIYGYTGNGETPEHIVLDGQQRLTAMYYAFVAPDVPAPNRTNRFLYFIRVDQFVAGDYDAAFEYDWSRKARKLADSRQLQYDAHRFPLAVIGTGGWELGNWVQGYEAHWRAKAEVAEQEGDADTAAAARQTAADAKTFGEHLRGITEEYQIAYIELERLRARYEGAVEPPPRAKEANPRTRARTVRSRRSRRAGAFAAGHQMRRWTRLAGCCAGCSKSANRG
jgi:hypothetical protein